jgi:hypothetical protein
MNEGFGLIAITCGQRLDLLGLLQDEKFCYYLGVTEILMAVQSYFGRSKSALCAVPCSQRYPGSDIQM